MYVQEVLSFLLKVLFSFELHPSFIRINTSKILKPAFYGASGLKWAASIRKSHKKEVAVNSRSFNVDSIIEEVSPLHCSFTKSITKSPVSSTEAVLGLDPEVYKRFFFFFFCLHIIFSSLDMYLYWMRS